MSRVRSVLMIPVLAVAMLGGGASASAQPAIESCGGGGHIWPRGDSAMGSALVGRVTGTSVNHLGHRVYRFDVLRWLGWSPRFSDPIKIMLVDCVETSFRMGGRYLVSSGVPNDGLTVKRLEHSDRFAVARRVWPDDSVKLMGYGAGTDWDEVPAYLDDPETLREAIQAIRD